MIYAHAIYHYPALPQLPPAFPIEVSQLVKTQLSALGKPPDGLVSGAMMDDGRGEGSDMLFYHNSTEYSAVSDPGPYFFRKQGCPWLPGIRYEMRCRSN